MIKHVCSDCGARFHFTDSWLRHECADRCIGSCDHDNCQKCLSTDPGLPCLDCINEWRTCVEPTA